ncbi:MAG TPA: hypothetical protein VFR47_23205 [Anaerolineales bacterium]|nr:hypothetical protein [Anaerolineales bacterium]
MKKKFSTILAVLLIAMLAISPVYAGGVSGKIGLGSITFTGYAYGFSRDAVTISLYATGIPDVTCRNASGKVVPGQNPVPVTGDTSANVAPSFDENGKFAVTLEAEPVALSAVEMGCPSNRWDATIDFVYWNYVKITVTENATGNVLWEKDSSCTTTRNPDTITCPAFNK